MVQNEKDNTADEHELDNQDHFDDPDPTTWIATEDMEDLPTAIFKKNTLPQTVRKTILQSEPRNKAISFEPPIMDKKIWTNMPKYAKEQDKNLRRTSYRFSSVVRPIDNALRLVYAAKPDTETEQYPAWATLEQTILNARALALDALSFTNELRQEQALKATISSTYHKPPEKEEVFGEELHDTIKRENETNKLLNDAAWQRKRASQNRNQGNNSSYSTNSNLNFRFPPRNSNYRGRGRRNNNNNNNRDQRQNSGNDYRAGRSSSHGRQE
jgi:hypothetical protein